MTPNVLLVVRKSDEEIIAVYGGVDSNQHIYGKLLMISHSSWPNYMRLKRSLSDAVLDENGKGTGVRKWFIDGNNPPKYSKNFRAMKASIAEDEDFIDIVNQTLEDKEFCKKTKSFLREL